MCLNHKTDPLMQTGAALDLLVIGGGLAGNTEGCYFRTKWLCFDNSMPAVLDDRHHDKE